MEKKNAATISFPVRGYVHSLSLSIRTPLPLRLSLSCPSANLLLAEPLATTGVSENRRRGWGW